MINKGLFKKIFSDKRLRMSHPRFLIYSELSGIDIPLSPKEIYQSLIKKRRRIGLTSIYRSLELFESLGIVFKIINGSKIKYKLCELISHHHHVVCKKCGSVVELDFCGVSEWSKKVKEMTGYEVTDHQLNFYGFCRACRRESKRRY